MLRQRLAWVVLALLWMALFLMLAGTALGATGVVADSTGDDAITGGAALGAGVIAGGFAVAGNRQANKAAAQRDEDARLSKVRQEAAADIAHIIDLGGDLERAISELLATVGVDVEVRKRVIDASSTVDARLDFIWDGELQRRLREFSKLARESAADEAAGAMRERAMRATEEWKCAKERAGVVSSALMRAVVKAQELLPDDEDKAA